MNDSSKTHRHSRSSCSQGEHPICFVATPNNAASLAALHQKCFDPSAWSLEQVESSLRLPTTIAVVAQQNQQAVGLIFVQVVGDEAEILTFGVDPASRRLGTGFLLLERAFDLARGKGATRAFLEVAADNTAALALYQKAGFQRMGARTGYYKRDGHAVDAVTMERTL